MRAWKLAQTQGYCEICYAEGWRGVDALAVDIHHKIPVESVIDQGEAAMARVCFNPANLQALCVRHHSETHKSMGKDTKENIQERKAKKRIAFLRRNDPNFAIEQEQDDACISPAEHEQSRTECNFIEEETINQKD